MLVKCSHCGRMLSERQERRHRLRQGTVYTMASQVALKSAMGRDQPLDPSQRQPRKRRKAVMQHSSDGVRSSPNRRQSDDDQHFYNFEDGPEVNADGPGAEIADPQSPEENNVQDLWDSSNRNEQHEQHEQHDFRPRQHRLRFDVDFELSDSNSENEDNGNSDHGGDAVSDIELEDSDSQESEADDARTPQWSRQHYTNRLDGSLSASDELREAFEREASSAGTQMYYITY